jgi:hypothetical protein
MKRMFIAALCTMFGSCAFASDEVTAPQAGTYAGLVYVQSAGSGCLDVTGATYFGEVSFGGLSNKTVILRIPLAGNGLAVSSVQTLTVTSGSGTTHQSGTLAWTGTGVGNSWNVSGTFSQTITEVGTHAFNTQMTESYATCSNEKFNVSLVRMGVKQ